MTLEISYRPVKIEKGFTLIELMVVLVVVAILLSAMTQSFRFGSSDELRSQQAKLRGLLMNVADLAVFEGKPYLLTPDKKGLQVWSWASGEWRAQTKIADYEWPENIEPTWQLEVKAPAYLQLPAEGWLFWPSGEATAGKIELIVEDKEQEISRQVEWNRILEFLDDSERPQKEAS
ncbi:prepilin-type N-terminal cleavage/methylation domain-containing protein [Thiomicrorhabdus indica]|uniref:prepilin-type N-terminal cleavage/methylation domain-containing protein n=1 Tax=Thiomicrorhabdus indica TaxID=2267253 RepID=UPI00102DEC31|nr:prepilin-type N-terminal cleavage/methylation domain-containing protein [Thiomicrorhabdus indica]